MNIHNYFSDLSLSPSPLKQYVSRPSFSFTLPAKDTKLFFVIFLPLSLPPSLYQLRYRTDLFPSFISQLFCDLSAPLSPTPPPNKDTERVSLPLKLLISQLFFLFFLISIALPSPLPLQYTIFVISLPLSPCVSRTYMYMYISFQHTSFLQLHISLYSCNPETPLYIGMVITILYRQTSGVA